MTKTLHQAMSDALAEISEAASLTASPIVSTSQIAILENGMRIDVTVRAWDRDKHTATG